MRAIITVIGKDRVGIIAAVSNVLADNNVNILDISQTIMQDVFTMIMLTDLAGMELAFDKLAEFLDATGKDLGLYIKIQHEDVFNSMHRI